MSRRVDGTFQRIITFFDFWCHTANFVMDFSAPVLYNVSSHRLVQTARYIYCIKEDETRLQGRLEQDEYQ